jgi:hypothetical protein
LGNTAYARGQTLERREGKKKGKMGENKYAARALIQPI